MDPNLEASGSTDLRRLQRNLLLAADTLDILAGKWKLRILITISHGCTRYRDILEANPGLSDKVLSHNLRLLTTHGLIERIELPAHSRPASQYRITPHGLTLRPLIAALSRWADDHRKFLFEKSL